MSDYIKDHEHELDLENQNHTVDIGEKTFAEYWCKDDGCEYHELKLIDDGHHKIANDDFCGYCFVKIDRTELNNEHTRSRIFYVEDPINQRERRNGTYYCSPSCVVNELLDNWF